MDTDYWLFSYNPLGWRLEWTFKEGAHTKIYTRGERWSFVSGDELFGFEQAVSHLRTRGGLTKSLQSSSQHKTQLVCRRITFIPVGFNSDLITECLCRCSTKLYYLETQGHDPDRDPVHQGRLCSIICVLLFIYVYV